MQPNKKKIALIIGAMLMGASGASNAADTGTYDITVNTIADVVLTEETALDFGTNIFTSAGTCVMNALNPDPADLQSDATEAAANYGDLTGSGCINGTSNGTPGIYKVSGTPGGTVNITLNGFTAASNNYSFTPNSSAYPVHDQTTTPDVDFTPLSTVAPTATELGGGADAGAVVDGELMFTLGGTLTVINPLAADTVFNTETFTVSVVY